MRISQVVRQVAVSGEFLWADWTLKVSECDDDSLMFFRNMSFKIVIVVEGLATFFTREIRSLMHILNMFLYRGDVDE